MIHIKPPQKPEFIAGTISLFLAGSIEMGAAEEWQTKVANALQDLDLLYILNPRRDAWDSTWKQVPENANFSEQVNWELYGIERSDIVAFYFDPNTKSPVTMLELGLALATPGNRIIVCCPDGFYRKGNIQITTNRYRDTIIHNDIESFIAAIRTAYGNIIVKRAYKFAENAHQGQVRKRSNIPYISHPVHVAQEVEKYGCSFEMVAAAFLHDVVEDCNVKVDELVKLFGPKIAKIVDELTNPSKDSKEPRDVRKKMDRDHIAVASKEAKIIKMMDRMHNISDMKDGPKDFGLKYSKESRQLLEVIKDADPVLADRLDKEIKATEDFFK